jgi:restriction system protein
MKTNMKHSHVPDAVGYMARILLALRGMDGSGKAAAVRDWIVATMSENNEVINETPLDSGVPKYQNDIQWARMFLVNAHLLEPMATSGRGNWILTPLGWKTPIDADTMAQFFMQSAKKGKKAESTAQEAPSEDDQQLGLPGMLTWDHRLKCLLTTMPHQGFERLCAEIMTKNGLHATKVTGQSGDKGIDGEGLLSFDKLELVSIRVAWQCKRFKDGTVGSDAVRNFRGSLDHSTDHGIIFTTSSFTTSAMQEASQPGKKPIRLVDLSALIDQIFKLKLGLSTELPHTLDMDCFGKFLTQEVNQNMAGLDFTPMTSAPN